ncbi:4Fe-4S dicluster domain-containing protein [bacterium]|nr:4Fe-4S dicluster domain-containing protein [bacterium]MBU1064772.1 4Fe-4S dicluster domain-containing protein [bacterium]MBU1633233.1 4Fe-4S dicluster domain-containing protein [bacterium]MBU1874180.1 4Fe-4S dicluster domain-containing protein [bacterium]
MFLPKLREVTEALKSLFSPAYTIKFPFKPYVAPEEYRGYPKFYEDGCIGCGTCAQVCPTNAIDIIDDLKTGNRKLVLDYASCSQCGQCEEKCITNEGIKLSSNYVLSTPDLKAPEVFEIVEKSLAICEACGKGFACHDHLLFVKERLGAKAYAHPNLLIETQRQFTDLKPSAIKDHIRREDLIKMVCPVCRHKTVVSDEF